MTIEISVHNFLSCPYFLKEYEDRIKHAFELGKIYHRKVYEKMIELYPDLLIEHTFEHLYSYNNIDIIVKGQPDIIDLKNMVIYEIKSVSEKKTLYPVIQLSMYYCLLRSIFNKSFDTYLLLYFNDNNKIRVYKKDVKPDTNIIEKNLYNFILFARERNDETRIVCSSCKYCPEIVYCKPDWTWRFSYPFFLFVKAKV